MKYLLFYVIPISIAVSLVVIIRFNTKQDSLIAGFPFCTDTAQGVTLDLITNRRTQLPLHPKCWSGWIRFAQPNPLWSVDHDGRPLEFYYQNGVREPGSERHDGQLHMVRNYPGGAFRLRGAEGLTTIALRNPNSPSQLAGPEKGAPWTPPPPAKVEPLPPERPPQDSGGAFVQPLPPERPQQESGGASYQSLPAERPRRESGGASYQPLPSLPSRLAP